MAEAIDRSAASGGPPRPLVSAWGLAAGWIGTLLLARHEIFWFAPPDPAGTPMTYCRSIGYAKEADYVWYVASIAGGCGGALLFRLLAGRSGRPNPPRLARRGPLPAAAVALIAALGLACSHRWGRSPAAVLLWGFGVILPWLDTGWYRRPATVDAPGPVPSRARHWSVGVLLAVLACAYTRDPGIASRPLDGIHEGVQSVFVQNLLSGDRPGIDFAAFYGPVQSALLGGWVRANGPTLLSLRWYFAATVALGTIVHLLLVQASAGSLRLLVAGTWLMLSLSVASVVIYGWMDALRTAIPLAGVWLFMQGLTPTRWPRMAAGAGLLGIGTAYAQEFGVAGMAGLGVAWLTAFMCSGDARTRPALIRAALASGGAGLLGWLGIHVLLFGSAAPAVLAASAHWGYAAERLAGHGARPLPEFPWWGGPVPFTATWPRLRLSAAVWVPSLLIGISFARTLALRRSERAGVGALLLGWSAVLAVSHLTVIARPMTQLAWSAPALVLLLVALLSDLERRGAAGRRWSGVAALVAVLWPMVTPLPIHAPAVADAPAVSGTGRLAGLRVSPDSAAFIATMIPVIQRLCPEGRRLYFADPFAAYLPFLAGRATVGPYPVGSLVISRDGVDRVLRSLETERPPVAIIGVFGIDLPFQREHPQEWSWLNAHYRLRTQIRDTLVFVRR